jgi:hypothetical protein
VVANFLIVVVSVLSGQSIMGYAWPIEIFLSAIFLALIGWGTEKWGVMIPSGIVFGNALIFAYCSLTGRWGDWAFLWMAELIIVWLSIFFPVQAGRIPNAGPIWTRTFGAGMTILCLFCIFVSLILSSLVASLNHFIS